MIRSKIIRRAAAYDDAADPTPEFAPEPVKTPVPRSPLTEKGLRPTLVWRPLARRMLRRYRGA